MFSLKTLCSDRKVALFAGLSHILIYISGTVCNYPSWGYMMESFGEKFLSQFEVCGSHLYFTAVLSFNYKKASLITSPAFCMFQFHKIAACTALFFSLLHTVGHIVNFYHVSTQPVEHLRCLTSEVHFPSDYKPGITFWLFQTITGWLCCWNNIHWVVELYIVN